MNGAFIREMLPHYVEAAKLTVSIGMIGVVGSLLVGLILAFIRIEKIPVLNGIAGAYIELSRNTPLLIQLFFLYFGLPKIGIVLSSEACAIVGLIFLGSSYMAETFRSGLEAVDDRQIEAAKSIGLTSSQRMRYVVLPQAIAVAVPSIGANIIFLLKETSVFSAVALADLMYVAKDLIGIYYETDEALLLLVLSYLVILVPVAIIFSLLERRLRHGIGSGALN
ncbi:MAG: amino acid ABC transporter permease [Peptoniphilus sp.]|nr:amino acid ABC transporter permease [Peptoniphilus sp.]MDD7363201.1 amino acid ABC transporter permease [Bacillota bacterium]MDY6044475.1 amino acid ABC transporter permease [Peptoniphilus sp.]